MSKPKIKKSGSKSKKRIPARKKRPTCKHCHTTRLSIYEAEKGCCDKCAIDTIFANKMEKEWGKQ